MKTYGIKRGYLCNLETVQPSYSIEASLVYQRSVYEYALNVAGLRGAKSILDVGCGLGLKLEAYFLPTEAEITGVDVEDTIAQCRARHEFGCWIADDIEHPVADLGDPFDLIICADVIEHLDDPDCLLNYLKKWISPGKPIIISTPERDLRRGTSHQGPPPNKSHVREWNEREFSGYLNSCGLEIHDHRIVALRDDILTCQLACCTAT